MLTKNLRNSEAVRVLDFGCGYGESLAMCSFYGFDACGVDRSSARRDHSGYSYIFAELDDLKASLIGSKKFHAVTLFEVLEHLDDPLIALESLDEFMAIGGILVLETPDCSGVTNIVTRTDYLKIHPLDHINGFTPQTLKAMAERLGFAQIRAPEVHVTGDPLRVAKTEIRRAIGGLRKLTTQQYFRKL
jgi:2-polyprenyl-3-methyl-5-hydroxy-6-metoxy-1,4-benzoquinol methylase